MVVCATAIDAGTKLLLSLLFLLFLYIANPVVDVLTDVACVVVPSTAVPCVNVVRYVFVCDNGDVGGIVTVAFSADAVGAVSVMRVGEIEQVFWIWSATDVDAHVDAVAYGAEAVDKVFVDVSVGVS